MCVLFRHWVEGKAASQEKVCQMADTPMPHLALLPILQTVVCFTCGTLSVFAVEKWVSTVQTIPEGRSTSSSFLFLPLDFSDRGDFSATTELPEGRHEYKFVVDGQWRNDPYAVSM